MNVKHLSISSYADLEKISPAVEIVHFRKFASEKLVRWILENHSQIRKFSFSKYSSSRCDSNIFDLIERNNVQIVVQDRGSGRPNLLEMI
ncbi:MAG: hypothetical protein COY38_01615 [Candidatus Aenigmarchaeota archaeon CG_4_10_14_0_8_um_filter_37_24]|nr:hypothetical protein [Candidatus Aenigmarchaeota archaeon]OIN88681.1 MAG: hypothetical protein AUJ50_00210 [Candidatus Aenigmarchaeota archaeon CG1_02_38_14]PIW41283.1 MAG: hypothetical protein COW21_02775 [Candidatus Aenigmarchaeota archaeon CG15_BIG_FIL_POST_REV_8_21_14_020_37_27]PIX50590.1 MAG: hypothetical protein COZ52_03175 [Candidatus Aenigmarchaeota archaeon CG_4_8_14_3_um_filter_37_24]PIY35490.1 MAG: hypothetical protein COZ04_03180 [Candidatus Aenigmarchaeota archaeon CG_4_10_14_3_